MKWPRSTTTMWFRRQPRRRLDRHGGQCAGCFKLGSRGWHELQRETLAHQWRSYTTITNVTATAFTDTNALINRTYYVVSAVNAQGEGANSAPVSVGTIPMAAWFKADALTNLADGAPVAVWPDASGRRLQRHPAVGRQPADFCGEWLERPTRRSVQRGQQQLPLVLSARCRMISR